MKKLHFFVIVALVLLGISSNVYSAWPKLSLMERLTGASCSPCASYNEGGYAKWASDNRDKVAIITYHGPFGGTDVFYHAAEANNTVKAITDARTGFWISTGEPASSAPEVKWNGKHPTHLTGSTESNPSSGQLDQLLDADAGQMTPVKIVPTLTIEGDVATVNVEVTTEIALDSVKLHIIIVESACNFATPPGTNGERVFPYVAKFALPNANGTILNLASNQVWDTTLTQTGLVAPKIQELDRLYVVAFVEKLKGGYDILQTAMSCETVPYPPIYEARTTLTTDMPYNNMAHEELVTHTLTIENVDDYEILVTPKFHRISSGQDSWEIVESNLPEEPFIIAPKTTKVYEYSIAHNGDRPASLQTAWELDCIMSQAAMEELGGVTLNKMQIGGYIDMTDDIKYAFITGLQPGDFNYSYRAFSVASRFNDELINIPSPYSEIPHPSLFMGDFLDNLEFLGFHTAPWTWVYDVAYNPNSENIVYKYAMQNKLASMKNTRMFMSSDPYTHWQLIDISEGGNAPDAEWKPERTAVSQFLFDEFGVWSGSSATKPWMTALFYRLSLSTVYPRALFGEEGDSIAMAMPTLILNKNIANSGNIDYYMTMFDSLSEYATSVYNFYDYIYVLEDGYIAESETDIAADGKGKYIIDDSVLTKNVMVKWDKDGIRRVTAGFNFAMISGAGGPNADIVAVANSIVDWMFAPTSIEDGETNMSTKNGLLLRTEPNPVTSASHVIVQNTNNLPVSAKVYLLDVSGKMVMNLFDGTLQIGDNYMELSNSNVPVGTYFVVTETSAGKTYMSVVVAK